MKKIFYFLLLSWFLIPSWKLSAMMEREVEKKGSEDNPTKIIETNSKQAEIKALQEAALKGPGDSRFSTTEVISTEVIRDIKPGEHLKSSFNESGNSPKLGSEEEEKNLWDVNIFNQKMEEADEALAFLVTSIRLDETELHPLYDYWTKEAKNYSNIFQSSFETKEVNEENQEKLGEVINKCEDVVEAVQERLNILSAYHTTRIDFDKLPFKEVGGPTKLALESKGSFMMPHEEVEPSFLGKDFSNLKIAYHLSQLIGAIEGMPSDEAKAKEYTTIQNALRKQKKKISLDIEGDKERLKQAAKSFKKAKLLHQEASENAERANQLKLGLNHFEAQSLYEASLQTASSALLHTKEALALYRPSAWRQSVEEFSKQLEEKISQWSVAKCQAAKEIVTKKKKTFEELEIKAEEEKAENEIISIYHVLAIKLGVMEKHLKSATTAYMSKDDSNGRLHEEKARKIASTISSLEKDLQSSEKAKQKWDAEFQTKESRCLERREQELGESTKLIREVWTTHFAEPLLLVETKLNSVTNTFLKKKEMAAENLMVTLHPEDTPDNFLAKIQESFPSSVTWEMKAILPQYQLYTLCFQAPLGVSKLNLFDQVKKTIHDKKLAAHCEPNEVIVELVSSKLSETAEKGAPESEQLIEPWGLSAAPIGINPPHNLFNETTSVVPKPAQPIRVAVLDTGIRYTHQAFEEKIHFPEDDLGSYGYDATVQNSKLRGYPKDLNGHGTHVAGIIAAKSYEVTEVEKKIADTFSSIQIIPAQIRGVASMEGMVELIICKNVIPKVSKGFIDRTLRSIDYARQQGAQIMNCSWGGAQDSEEMTLANLAHLQAALGNEYILPSGEKAPPMAVVAAAGNLRSEQAEQLLKKAMKGELLSIKPPSQEPKTQIEFNNLILNNLSETEDPRNKDVYPSYPAGLPLPNAIAVGATNKDGELAPISYYGKQAIQITAPGTAIISAWHTGNDAYRVLTGTSMATPHATAALALMKAKFPNLSYEKLIEHLSEQADKIEPPPIKVAYGRLHLAKALEEPTSEETEIDSLMKQEKFFQQESIVKKMSSEK